MSLTLITPPEQEPVTLEEMRKHLRLDADLGSPPVHEDDVYVSALITVARDILDGPKGRLGLAIVTQTWDLALDGFPCGGCIDIPLPPVQSITSVTYLDTDGVEQTLDAAVYRLVGKGWRPRLELNPGQAWPSTYCVSEAVTVRFVAGFAPSADSPPDLIANVPARIKQLIKLYVGHYYQNREPAVIGATVSELPKAIDHLVDQLRKRS